MSWNSWEIGNSEGAAQIPLEAPGLLQSQISMDELPDFSNPTFHVSGAQGLLQSQISLDLSLFSLDSFPAFSKPHIPWFCRARGDSGPNSHPGSRGCPRNCSGFPELSLPREFGNGVGKIPDFPRDRGNFGIRAPGRSLFPLPKENLESFRLWNRAGKIPPGFPGTGRLQILGYWRETPRIAQNSWKFLEFPIP